MGKSSTVQGQIGKVTIQQNTALFQLGSNKKMTIVRTLKKREYLSRLCSQSFWQCYLLHGRWRLVCDGSFFRKIRNSIAGSLSSNEWDWFQAKLALQTYKAMKSVYGSADRPVLFIDVESASGCMKKYDYVNNLSIYNAFVNYINHYGQGVTPGTYTAQGEWGYVMGNTSPRTPGVYWVADYPGGIPSNPFWVNFPGTNEKSEIWQYYGGSVDYDVDWKLS